MGFLDRLFPKPSKVHSRERLGELIETIHARLRDERPIFFQACVEMLETLPNASILNRAMDNPTELAITVYQLNIGLITLYQNRYVNPGDETEYLVRLFEPVTRYGPRSKIQRLTERYMPDGPGETSGRYIFRFYSDLASYITGDEAPLQETMVLSQFTNNRLSLICQSAVAATFGDQRTVDNLIRYHQQRIKAAQ
jgi:hypothetical protein